MYATLRHDEDSAILTVINLSDEPIADYVITLSEIDVPNEANWQVGEVLMGGNVRDLSVVDGEWGDYRPVLDLPPLSTHIILIE